MAEEQKTPEEPKVIDNIDIESLKKSVADLEAAEKAKDEEDIKNALTSIEKLVSDALGEDAGNDEDPEDNPDDDPFAKVADKYK